jgi:hypothetical protein
MRPLLIKPKVYRYSLMLLLIPAVLFYGLSSAALCEDKVPVKKPQIEMSPDIPIQDDGHASKEKQSWLSRHKWWVAIGGVLLGGAAVAATTGSDDDGNNDDGSSYRLDW